MNCVKFYERAAGARMMASSPVPPIGRRLKVRNGKRVNSANRGKMP